MLRPDARMHLGLSRHGIADRAVLCRGLRRIVHDAHNRPLRVSATIGRYSARCGTASPTIPPAAAVRHPGTRNGGKPSGPALPAQKNFLGNFPLCPLHGLFQ